MPTPFMHLAAAERLIAHPALPSPAATLLSANLSAFVLGNVAPDFQILSGISRDATHFYGLPPRPADDPCVELLADYPELASPGRLAAAAAAFVAGYCAHLQLDVDWHRRVLQPLFIHTDGWESRRQRFLVHNTLLTYLDREALEVISAATIAALAEAEPGDWLPFARDRELRAWRDLLAVQLEPGGTIQTVEVFAGRMGMAPADFAANLDDPAWMAEQLFGRVPVEQVRQVIEDSIGAAARFAGRYLAPRHGN